jgi:uncharacterized protein YecT (DUF1311 family)
MKGIYQHCQEKLLHRYLAEYDFRYNSRVALGVDDSARTPNALRGPKGNRKAGKDKAQGKVMHSTLLAIALLIAGASAAPAQNPSCMDTAKTQWDLTQCSLQELRAANRKMAAAYKAVMCHQEGDDKKALAASQRAFEAFRKADCAFWGGGGSISAMNVNLCAADLANRRATELDTWPPNAPRDDLVPCH